MVVLDMLLRVVTVVMVMVVGVKCVTTTPTPSTETPPEDLKLCPSTSCEQRNGSVLSDELCHCDPLCNTYHDCCYDSQFRKTSSEVIGEGSDVECHAVGVYVKARCKEGWSDVEVEELCVGGGVDTDPMSRLPVTSKATRHTYPNYYCAICNQDILDLRIWNGELECDGLGWRDRVGSKDLILRNNELGVLRGSPESQEFVACSLVPSKPRDVANVTRSCELSISTCSDDWQDKETEALCHSYTDVVYHNNTAYKNHYCAICNNIHDYDCPGILVIQRFPFPAGDFIPPSFSMIFDFTDPSHGNLVGSTSPCDATQVWDPFFKRCRSIVCPKPNQNYRYGKCVTLGDVNSMESREHPTVPPDTNSPADAANDTNESNNSDPVNRNNDDHNTNTSIVTNSNNTSTVNNTTDVINTTTPVPSNTTHDNVTAAPSKTFPDDKQPIVFPEEPTEPQPQTTVPTPSEEEEEEGITTLPPSTPSPNTDPTSPSDTAASTNTTSEFSECKKITLLHGEFSVLGNGSVYVGPYKRTYTDEEYTSIRKGIMVCQPDSFTSRKFSAALGWLSLAGLGLSCTCLLLHLAAFTLLPELRNLSGKNLASLCLALLAAYVTLLVNMFMQGGSIGCITLAAAMYYFLVTSFTWMNVIAFDVWYTFRLSQRQLRVSQGDQWHRFIAYSVYSWLVPAAATLVLVLVDQLEPSALPVELLPRLGRSWCWFSHRKALLAFFAAPIVIIIIMNSFFFIRTAVIITQTGSSAAATSARGNHPSGQQQYKMYLRLAVLMGFTWVSGIAAGYLAMEILWYVFVVLNTLQGVFIFLAFTFRTRVWHGVGTTFNKVMQRAVSIVTRRPPQSDIRTFELSHTPDTTSAAYSTHDTSLETC